jgi:hypothetical protein
MTGSEWLWLSVGLGAALLACFFAVPRLWRGEQFGRDFVSDDSGAGAAWIRSAPTACFTFLAFIIACFGLGLLTPEEGTAPTWLAVVTCLVLGVGLVLMGTIVAFNVPKALVPPQRRQERGMLSTKRNNRTGGPAAGVDRPDRR